jgi:hypothetical protein
MKVIFILFMGFLFCISCDKNEDNQNVTPSRFFLMGFQNSAPRYDDLQLVLQTLELWTKRADAAIVTSEVPWDSLLQNVPVADYINRNYTGLVNYYRSKGLKLWVYIDPANGLNRATDAISLVKAHKSISQLPMQQLYRKFAIAMDSILKPEHLGLALETNFIRDIAPDSIYQGVKKAANDAASAIRLNDKNVKLSISVQVEWAWGKLLPGNYRGISQDLTDFQFIEELGLSSYPYLVFNNPSEIPSNYYLRVVEGLNMPIFVSEGGWSTVTTTTFAGSPQKQTDYVRLHSKLLNSVKALAYFQLVFTDIDMTSMPPDIPENLSTFANIGFLDIDLKPKPAMAVWDSLYNLAIKTGSD